MIATYLTNKGMQRHDVKGNLSGIVAFTHCKCTLTFYETTDGSKGT